MIFTRTRAMIACTLLAGVIATPAFGQSYGLIARGDCPKAARAMGRTHTPAPAPSMTYKPVAELERYIASLQAAAPAEQPREHARPKRAKRLPSPF